VKNRPAYAVDSVDHALHLAQLLQQEGSLRVTDAADRLGVSRSTAHRLLAMLVYRDFAEQGSDRRYRAGPVLRPAPVTDAPTALLRRVALPHLHDLVERVQESANLMVLVGDEVRFVLTVECDQVLRVGDRVGRVLPAYQASGGKALLATLPVEELGLRLAGSSIDLKRLRRELTLVRKRGFAINDQATESGLIALGVVVRGAQDEPVAALSIALPKVRFDRDRLPSWVGAMRACEARIHADLAQAGTGTR